MVPTLYFLYQIGLQDAKTVALNTLLLFLILFYVYPLKFLFKVLYKLFYSMITQNEKMAQELFAVILKPRDGPSLMIIYGIGASLIFLVLAAMYNYALNKKRDLRLSPKETFDTKTSIYNNLLMASVPLLSVGISVIGLGRNKLTFITAGVIYNLYIFILPVFNIRRDKLRAKMWKVRK